MAELVSLDFEVVPFQPSHQRANSIRASCPSKTAPGDILQTTQRHENPAAGAISELAAPAKGTVTHEVTRTATRANVNTVCGKCTHTQIHIQQEE